MIRPRARAAGRATVPDADVRLRTPLPANGKPSLAQRKPDGAD